MLSQQVYRSGIRLASRTDMDSLNRRNFLTSVLAAPLVCLIPSPPLPPLPQPSSATAFLSGIWWAFFKRELTKPTQIWISPSMYQAFQDETIATSAFNLAPGQLMFKNAVVRIGGPMTGTDYAIDA